MVRAAGGFSRDMRLSWVGKRSFFDILLCNLRIACGGTASRDGSTACGAGTSLCLRRGGDRVWPAALECAFAFSGVKGWV
jgi:hypothetical protein